MAPFRLMRPLMISAALLATLGVLVGCDEKAGAPVEPVKINGHVFHLEIAADEATRIKGLGGRDHIEPDGGMIFVFTRAQPMAFVMRDCVVPIDIAYLDGAGRVVAMHEMTPEPPRRPDESAIEYERRLRQYPSRFPAQFAVEVAGGRFREIGLETGQRLDFDLRKLKRMAR